MLCYQYNFYWRIFRMDTKQKGKYVKDSALMNQRRRVRYEYLNALGKMHGGNIYTIMDELAATVAHDHSTAPCLTRFDVGGFFRQVEPIDTLVAYAYITKTWNSSMDIAVQVYKAIKTQEGETLELVAARHYTFVALDDYGQPIAVPPIIPENEEEKERMTRAELRRKLQKELEQLFDPPVIQQKQP